MNSFEANRAFDSTELSRQRAQCMPHFDDLPLTNTFHLSRNIVADRLECNRSRTLDKTFSTNTKNNTIKFTSFHVQKKGQRKLKWSFGQITFELVLVLTLHRFLNQRTLHKFHARRHSLVATLKMNTSKTNPTMNTFVAHTTDSNFKSTAINIHKIILNQQAEIVGSRGFFFFRFDDK